MIYVGDVEDSGNSDIYFSSSSLLGSAGPGTATAEADESHGFSFHLCSGIV